jgi:hypothetical protein
MRPKTQTNKPAAREEKNCGMEQRAPVTRKTATVKDYASVKQKAIVNHPATVKQSDRPQLDEKKSKVSKFPTDRQTAGRCT